MNNEVIINVYAVADRKLKVRNGIVASDIFHPNSVKLISITTHIVFITCSKKRKCILIYLINQIFIQ